MPTKSEKENFDEAFNRAYEAKEPDYSKHINIALVGKVSAGKSSLLNAIFDRDRNDPIAAVGAHSGVTTKVIPYKLGKEVLIIDCPGLSDVRAENSEQTREFLRSIDLAIFVVTGSADASQKENFEDVRRTAKKTFAVLNKVDEWDDLEDEALKAVKGQWEQVLGLSKLYPTCAKGYDPKMRKDAPMDIRGVVELRKDIVDFLEQEGKELLLARHLKYKTRFAATIIATALAAVAAEAFLPGSAAYITATQVVAITALCYLYTGEVLSKTSVLGLLPTFIGESVGTTVFLWLKSFLPPTGILDLAAALVAIVITFAMLAAITWMFVNGHSLDEHDLLAKMFGRFRGIGSEFKKFGIDDFKNKERLTATIERLLKSV
ncbi:MAG: 50S ribosome-binding GTPase [Betaproteobacteria bacterium]|nr:50S ribosome-binding GTPase [Betaproteobacteria bacterium]